MGDADGAAGHAHMGRICSAERPSSRGRAMVGSESERASWEGRESLRRAGALRAAGGNSTLKNWKLSAAQLLSAVSTGTT